MKATQQLHNLGQGLWLDNITRDLLDSGTLRRYIDELSVTGLTSNPTIFDHAIKNSAAYDREIREGLSKGSAAEQVFFNLALDYSKNRITNQPIRPLLQPGEESGLRERIDAMFSAANHDGSTANLIGRYRAARRG